MPSWKELKRFCEHDGWELYKITDHYFYRKQDADGNIRFTKVSKNPGQINRNLWNVILHRQLKVTKEYFNSKL